MANQQIIMRLLLAAVHLLLVLFGACHALPRECRSPWSGLVRWYAALSGGNSNYGFFAPTVGAKHVARFTLRDDDGHAWHDRFDATGSPEAGLRLTGIVETPFMSGQTNESPEWRQRLVASWAAAMFSRHPTAISLAVEIEFYDIPSIVDFRSGSRPQWEPLYRAALERLPWGASPGRCP